MAERKIDVKFNFIDSFTSSFQRSIGVLTSGTKAAERAWKGVEKTGQNITKFGQTLTTNVTLPIVGLGTVAVTKFAEVDKTMQLTNATMGNTAEQADLLNKAMQDAAANSTFGMADAAEATLNFARAGLGAEEAAAALAPAMNLAAGEGGDLNTVSAGLVGTINGFGDSFDQTARYADVFAAACNNSALDVNSLSESFSVAAPVFATAGMGVEDAALYMGIMANAGIDANVSANSLKTGMARLVAPAKQGADMMEQLGISVTNVDGSFKDTMTIQKELHDTFAGLSESEQMAAASAIFGKNQMAPWLALINTAPEKVGSLDTALRNSTGTTQEMADAMMGGFGGSIEKLKSSLDVLMTSLGQLAATYLQPVIDKVQQAVDAFNGMDSSQKDQVVRWAAIAAAIGPSIMIFGRVISVIGWVGMSFTRIAGFTRNAAAGFKALSAGAKGAQVVVAALTSPIGLVVMGIAALIAVVIAVKTHFDVFKTALSGAQPFIDSIREKAAALGERFSGLMSAMQPVGDFLGAVLAAAAGLAVAAFAGLADGIMTAIDGILQVLTGIIDFIVGVFTGDWEKAWQGVQEVFSGIVDVITGIIDGISNAISGILDGLAALFGYDGKTMNVNANVTETRTSSGGQTHGGSSGKVGTTGRARGDMNWRGGIVQVHERGGEIIDLPHGTRIYPHDKSVQMARAEGVSISIPKLADTIVVREQADIDRIADRLARKLQAAAHNMGGVSVANMD